MFKHFSSLSLVLKRALIAATALVFLIVVILPNRNNQNAGNAIVAVIVYWVLVLLFSWVYAARNKGNNSSEQHQNDIVVNTFIVLEKYDSTQRIKEKEPASITAIGIIVTVAIAFAITMILISIKFSKEKPSNIHDFSKFSTEPLDMSYDSMEARYNRGVENSIKRDSNGKIDTRDWIPVNEVPK